MAVTGKSLMATPFAVVLNALDYPMSMEKNKKMNLADSIKSALPALRGWCPEVKAIAMAEHIIQHRPKTIVEIGVFGGRSLIPMAMACHTIQNGIVHGIDPWSREAALRYETDPKNREWWSKLDYSSVYRDFAQAVLKHNLTEHCYWYRTEAHLAHSLFETIDMLHIDGNHSHESATRDVNLYVPKVKVGGFVWFDDIDWKSTQGALKELHDNLTYIKTVDRTAIFQKVNE